MRDTVVAAAKPRRYLDRQIRSPHAIREVPSMKPTSILLSCALPFAAAIATPVHAAEYASTVRLGSCVVRPGTTTPKLVKCTGEPISKDTTGVNLKNGKIEEVWLYSTPGRTC
jgi:hypothetical protein